MSLPDWRHLPNAPRIKALIECARRNPDAWLREPESNRNRAWQRAKDRAEEQARVGMHLLAWRESSLDEPVSELEVWSNIGGATLALVAYDDCGHLLDMSYERLLVWANVSEEPAAWLLLPAVWARELMAEKKPALDG